MCNLASGQGGVIWTNRIYSRVSLAAILKISKTHSCKRSSSCKVRPCGHGCRIFDWNCSLPGGASVFCLCWGRLTGWTLPPLFSSPLAPDRCSVLFIVSLPSLFRSQTAVSSGELWPSFQLIPGGDTNRGNSTIVVSVWNKNGTTILPNETSEEVSKKSF